jgi:ornithine cyclodeaminase/alanine dehydrogenase-like protein (mu-crystallin family)
MTLLISNENVQDALDSKKLRVESIIDAIEGAYRDLGADRAAYAPRRGVSVPIDEAHRHPDFQDEKFVFGVMEGAVQSSGYFAIRLKLDMTYRYDDPATGARTHEKYAMEPGRYCGLILLVDARTAEPLALMNDGVAQHLRVAATNILAARYMAREDAHVLGIYGSGGMAHSHARMMGHVRELGEVKVYSPTRAHREAFAAEMQDELKIPVTAVDRPEQLAEDCDMLAACTDSSVPVIEPDAIRPGMFLTCVTGNEVARDAQEKIDTVVLHQTVESSTLLTYTTGAGRISPAGLIDPIVQPPNPVYSTGPRVRGTLAELVNGRIQGRQSETEVNYFYNNIGSGIQFAAIAGEVYEVLRGTSGLREIPTDWLTQTVRD